jgi:hypothetical protein
MKVSEMNYLEKYNMYKRMRLELGRIETSDSVTVRVETLTENVKLALKDSLGIGNYMLMERVPMTNDYRPSGKYIFGKADKKVRVLNSYTCSIRVTPLI